MTERDRIVATFSLAEMKIYRSFGGHLSSKQLAILAEDRRIERAKLLEYAAQERMMERLSVAEKPLSEFERQAV